MNNVEWPMLSYFVIYYEKFKNVIQWTGKLALISAIYFFCPLYNDIRAILYESALLIDNDFNTYSTMDKVVFLMDNEGIIRNSAKVCHSILHRKRRYVYINDWLSLS